MKEPTLLDVFAGLAMHALLRSRPESQPLTYTEAMALSAQAFEIGRAMLTESIEADHGQSH